LVAFTAFQILKKRHEKLDLFNFLRLPEEEQIIQYDEFRTVFQRVRNGAIKLQEEDRVKIAPHIFDEIDKVIDHGLLNVGMYHVRRPVVKNRKGDIITEDLNTLYYYHNRMNGYDLEK